MSHNARKRFRNRLLFLIGSGLVLVLGLILLLRKKKTGWLRILRGTEYEKYIPWIVAQSQHETQNWKSQLFRNYNNLFGLKTSERVEWNGYDGPEASDGGTYAGYESWADSAQHFLNWLRYEKIPSNFENVEDYIFALKDRGYFTDSYDNYVNAVKAWIAKGW